MKSKYSYISSENRTQIDRLNILTYMWNKKGDTLMYIWSFKINMSFKTDLIDNIITI